MSEEGAASYTVKADILSFDAKAGNLTWKALLKPHAEQGGNLTITARCSSCLNTTATTVEGLTYGDVWFCAGQSNMELPMAHALTRNRTYDQVDSKGMYANIRTFQRSEHVAAFDGDERYLTAPPVPTPDRLVGWQRPNSSSIAPFSAACWFFAQELTDIAVDRNRTPPVLGLIQSAWGGTEIDDWLRNDTVAACKNASGAPEPNRPGAAKGAVYPDNGGLWNGMVAPFINYTIKGALWYQGENNVHECLEAPLPSSPSSPTVGDPAAKDGGVDACGNSLAGTGYACSTKNLVGSWRRQWSAAAGTTDAAFPFGIVSLAAGTSEGNANNMANFRHAQTASYGFLPGPAGSGMENTFIAQGYDAGDPGTRTLGPPVTQGPNQRSQWSEADSPYQSGYDAPFKGRQGYSNAGTQAFTQQYMGGLHPRAKQTVGRRLALAAAHVAYGQKDVPFTGPVLKSCEVLMVGARCQPNAMDAGDDAGSAGCAGKQARAMGIDQREIVLAFDEELLGDDAVQVWKTSPSTEGLATLALYNCLNGTCLTECGRRMAAGSSSSAKNGGSGSGSSTAASSKPKGNATCAHACVLNTPACRSGLPTTPIGPSANGGNPTQYNANHLHWKTGLTISPLEVQFNDSFWMPAPLSFNAGDAQNDPIRRNCQPDPRDPKKPPCANWTREEGWNRVVATVPVSLPIGCGRGLDQRSGGFTPCPPRGQLRPGEWCENCTAHLRVTGVRYAWAEEPCCGGNTDTNTLPCPVNSCPISTWNSTLPAVPFSAGVVYNNDTALGTGQCRCTPPQVCH